MHQLKTPLSVEESVRVLREQAAPRGLLANWRIWRPKTSKVLGSIRKDSFVLESSNDAWSKRFVGKFESGPEMTLITYEWKKQGLHHRLFGDSSFDEEEILSFLHEWLNTEWFNKSMQLTVMSRALWYPFDHLPGSCLLLISMR